MMKSLLHTLFTVPSHEAGATGAQSRDVIAVGSVPALAGQGAVLPIEAQRTACQTPQDKTSNMLHL